MPKYALCVDINKYLHVTFQCYDTDRGFDPDAFIRDAAPIINDIIEKYPCATIRNRKTRYESFSPNISHVAVSGRVLTYGREQLDSLMPFCEQVANPNWTEFKPHLTYRQSKPQRARYSLAQIYLKEVRGPIVHWFGSFLEG